MAEIATLASANVILFLLLPFLSGMLYDFFQPGMVFGRYGDWLFREERNGYDTPAYKKPLGACLKCFHVWVSIAFIIVTGDLNIKYLPLLGLSYYILTFVYYRE